MRMYALHDYDSDLKKNGAFQISQDNAADLNSKGYGIFFTPNTFTSEGRIESALVRLGAWFIDYDSGTKDMMLDKIEMFPLIPSMLIETHKGFHSYWRCSESLVEENRVGEYSDVLEKVVKHFGADENAMGVNRILRYPNYFHCKDPLNKFLIKEIFTQDGGYTCEEMLSAIGQTKREKIEKKRDVQKIEFFNSVPQDDFWESVYALNCFEYLPALSNSLECNNEVFTIERVGSKGRIYANGQMVESCWIDHDGKIGSHAQGGPSLGNWIKWYGCSWDEVAKCLKRNIPEIAQRIQLSADFDW